MAPCPTMRKAQSAKTARLGGASSCLRRGQEGARPGALASARRQSFAVVSSLAGARTPAYVVADNLAHAMQTISGVCFFLPIFSGFFVSFLLHFVSVSAFQFCLPCLNTCEIDSSSDLSSLGLDHSFDHSFNLASRGHAGFPDLADALPDSLVPYSTSHPKI